MREEGRRRSGRVEGKDSILRALKKAPYVRWSGGFLLTSHFHYNLQSGTPPTFSSPVLTGADFSEVGE